jgi:hypothetical protein
MKARRNFEIGLALLAIVAWTVYCLSFFVLLGTPSIEGAENVAAQARLMIVGGWLAGMSVGLVAVYGLWRGVFDQAPRSLRIRLAAAGLFATAVLLGTLYSVGLSGVLVFLWAPIGSAVLLLVGWACRRPMRRRLQLALMGWLIGCAMVAALWLVLPPGALGFHFWTLLALVSVAAATWWAVPLIPQPKPPGRDVLP